MAAVPPGSTQPGLREEDLTGLGEPMKALLVKLLLHKSVFGGEWFRTLARAQASRESEALLKIHDETVVEAFGSLERLREWDRLPHEARKLEELVREVHVRLLESLIALKEGSTEAYLMVALQAPTAELRDALIRLADVDREHADSLRALLGTRALPVRLAAQGEAQEGKACGAHQGRYRSGPLSRSIESTLENLRRKGSRPLRLALSPTCLRHLRDEGRIDPEKHEAFGLPVDVDLAWEGETFAVITQERVSLAEIVTAGRART